MKRNEKAALRRRDMVLPVLGFAVALLPVTGASAQEQPPGGVRRPPPPGSTTPPGSPPAKKPPEPDNTALNARRRSHLAGALNGLKEAKRELAHPSIIPSRRVNAHIDAAIAEVQIAFNKTA